MFRVVCARLLSSALSALQVANAPAVRRTKYSRAASASAARAGTTAVASRLRPSTRPTNASRCGRVRGGRRRFVVRRAVPRPPHIERRNLRHERIHRGAPHAAVQCVVRVTNLTNGKQTEVRINDRGPFVANRVIDLSLSAAQAIEMVGPGTAHVRLEMISGPNPTVGIFRGADRRVQGAGKCRSG